MAIPERSAQGQTIQQGSTPLGSDTAPVLQDAGNALKMTLVAGKDGSVTKIAMAQTDYTDVHAGHAPPFDA